MAVLGRLLISSAERLDLPDLLSIDSYAAGDWKYFLKGLVGDTKPFILKGFDVIDPGNAIGTQSCSIRVAESVTFYPGSLAGSFYHGLPEGNPQAVPLVPELRKNAVNYIYLTFSTFNTSVDTRAFWDPDKDGGAGGEFTQDINTESVLSVQVNVSTGSFPANTVPVAKVTVGPVVITAIEDARDMMFRLGTGGISPDPFNTYAWRSLPGAGYTRTEPPTNMQAGGVNPFQGADKNILTLKEWMDAVMSKLRELGGTTYWYDDTSTFGIVSNFFDAVGTLYKSKGQWVHSSATPGLLTWTEDIQVILASDNRTYIIRAGNKTLADGQVMYIPMVRNQPFNPTDELLSWTNGQNYVNTIGGAVGLFANLVKGDYVRKANDSIDKWLRVEEFYDAISLGGSVTTPALARSIRLSGNYQGVTLNEKGRHDTGAYTASDIIVSNRSSAAIANTGGNFHWLAIRSDTIENVGSVVSHSLSLAISEHDGATAKVVSAAHGLVDGDRITITGTTNFNGTYKVEVETTSIFYITLSGGPFANESGSGFYATVTTAARTSAFGFVEESANHGFRSDDTIIVAGTTNFNGQYLVNVTGATTFTIPRSSAPATETVGTATLARIIVRDEGAAVNLIQGQAVDIGGSVADNIRQYVGMGSLSETAPQYAITPGYNTLDGMQNYNGVFNDNLTARASKLTAMMADKTQDKTIKLLHSGYSSMTNTTSGANQLITFVPDANPPPKLNILMPGSPFNGTVGLTGTLTLAANQAAYFMVDRNNAFTIANLAAVTVAAISSVPIEENVFILAARFATNDIWLWDGSRIPGNTTVPSPEYMGAFAELIGGGTVTNIFSPGGGSPHLNDASAIAAQAAALAAYTDLAGRSVTANYTGVDLGTLTLTPGVYKWNTSAQLTGTITLDAAFNPNAVWIFQIGSTLTTASASVVNIINGGDAKNVFWQVGSSATLGTTTNFKGTIIAQVSITANTGANAVAGRFLALTGAVTLDTNNVTAPIATTAPLAPTLGAVAAYAVLASSTVTNTGSSIITGELGVSPGTSVTGFPPGIIIGGSSVPELTFTAPFYLEKAGLSYTDNTIPISNSPIVFPNNFDVAYVIPNLSPGGPLLTVVVGALSTVPTNAVIIARREGNDIIVGNSMRLVPLESGVLYNGVSDQLLLYIGAPSAGDSTPAYVHLPNGLAPFPVAQGASLTLAIDQTMGNVNSILTVLDQPAYDEFREIVTAGATGNQLNAPIPSGTVITLPNNSRLSGSPAQSYVVGKGQLEIFLNGQILQLGEAGGWTQIGAPLSLSTTIQINQDLVVGDFLTFRIDGPGGPGSGGGGGSAPDDDFFTLPASGTADNADFVLIYDTSVSAYRKQLRSVFLSGISKTLIVTAYAANHLADVTLDDVILVDAQLAARTITLPTAASSNGKVFYIKKVDSSANAVIIDAAGSETIDGALTVTTSTQYENFTIVSNGTSWWIL